jgi:hypothetical protein
MEGWAAGRGTADTAGKAETVDRVGTEDRAEMADRAGTEDRVDRGARCSLQRNGGAPEGPRSYVAGLPKETPRGPLLWPGELRATPGSRAAGQLALVAKPRCRWRRGRSHAIRAIPAGYFRIPRAADRTAPKALLRRHPLAGRHHRRTCGRPHPRLDPRLGASACATARSLPTARHHRRDRVRAIARVLARSVAARAPAGDAVFLARCPP